MVSILHRIVNYLRNPSGAEVKNFLLLKDLLPDALIVVDEFGKIVEVNDHAERMFGYTREEMLGQSIEMLVPERYRDLHMEERLRYARSPKTRPMGAGLDLRALKKDGTEFPVDISLAPVETKEGLRVIAVVRDMSRREETIKKAFAEIEKLFRILTEASLVGVYFIQDWRFVYVNQALASMLGYTVDELTGELGPLDIVHPDDHPKIMENIHRCITGEIEGIRYELRMVKKEGTIIYVEDYGKRVEYKGKIGILGTVVNITERKQMEKALKKELAINESLVEVTKAINQTLDLDSLLELIVDEVLELTNSKHGGLFILDETNGVLKLRASRGIAPEIAQSLTFKIGESIAGWVAETGEGVLLYDVEKHPRFKKIPQLERFSSMITVPLIVRGKVFGVLGVDRLEGEEPFTEIEFRIAQSFAEQAALAIQNSQLFEEVKTRKEYLETILESSQDLIFTVRKDGALGYANKRLKEILGYDFEDVKGRHFFEFIPQHLHDFMLKKWEEIQQEASGVYDAQVIRADGSIANCRISHSKLEGRDEYVLILRDLLRLREPKKNAKNCKSNFFKLRSLKALGRLPLGLRMISTIFST
jgi:PAS domain S-box-containing protein